MNDSSSDDPIIHRYTRADAIADDVLVDVTEWASTREVFGGFTIPVAMTAGLWALVQAPKRSTKDTRGRAHDVIWMASAAVPRGNPMGRHAFKVRLGSRNVALVIEIHAGDDGETVATIMFPEED